MSELTTEITEEQNTFDKIASFVTRIDSLNPILSREYNKASKNKQTFNSFIKERIVANGHIMTEMGLGLIDQIKKPNEDYYRTELASQFWREIGNKAVQIESRRGSGYADLTFVPATQQNFSLTAECLIWENYGSKIIEKIDQLADYYSGFGNDYGLTLSIVTEPACNISDAINSIKTQLNEYKPLISDTIFIGSEFPKKECVRCLYKTKTGSEMVVDNIVFKISRRRS